MKRVLYDLNVVLDVLLAREPFCAASAAALDAVGRNQVQGYLAAHLVTTLYYLLRRQVGAARAKTLTVGLLTKIRVAPLTDEAVRRALALPFRDLEDAVCHAAAEEVGATFIVTRNVDDFSDGIVPAVLPEVFTRWLSGQSGEG